MSDLREATVTADLWKLRLRAATYTSAPESEIRSSQIDDGRRNAVSCRIAAIASCHHFIEIRSHIQQSYIHVGYAILGCCTGKACSQVPGAWSAAQAANGPFQV